MTKIVLGRNAWRILAELEMQGELIREIYTNSIHTSYSLWNYKGNQYQAFMDCGIDDDDIDAICDFQERKARSDYFGYLDGLE